MFDTLPPLPERADCTPDSLPLETLLAAGEPVVLRGLARDWGLVRAADSMASSMDYLRRHYNGEPVTYSWGGPEIAGRPFYREDFSALNCEVRRSHLDQVLAEISAHADDAQPPTYYVASLLVDSRFPGMRADNDLDLARQGVQAPPSIWIGNRVTASCHYDALNNIAVCVAGRRRFTLLPPAQIHNLYPGPLEPTPGGQAVSVVDFAQPDLQRYPRFADAMAHARTAVLEPGDAIFMPSLWWHHVQGLEPFNVLVNYWWSSVPAYLPSPMQALYQALWTLRDRPEREKQAWREVFDYYVFGPAELAGAHLPPAARNVLGPVDEAMARQLRAMLIGKLNR
ncbi:cupin-like domain-containing protein [Pseudoxanthomonas indica]|uniref:Cupin-like domain-containing protein n=1 Tax=Pseudoxanthomonas indica TaxID=428993 RepID=A0A1T5K9R6_9GAMM|nr:cupin-like domain-containing protein [Pseudoxanthomonas indica]GGD47636.1 cupin [Pseudoxanthomonas indica]SKC60229.1 Cupin-like domain-containing protein [Pseudoxanthomonas indica]